MTKPIAKCWNFASSSGRGHYETLQYTDGTTSCNCNGWTRRIDAQGKRSCKHTRSVDMGRADLEAENLHDYATAPAPAIATPAPAPALPLRKGAAITFGATPRKLSL